MNQTFKTVTPEVQKVPAGWGKYVRVYLSDKPVGKVVFETDVHKYVCLEVHVWFLNVQVCVYFR